MKISASKKQLARIISDNGGWRYGEFSAQDGDGSVGGYGIKPKWDSLSKYWWRDSLGSWFSANKINNHHQTIVSRAEYFHLYPAQDAEAEEPEHVWTNPPTIEQLATEYRSRKDYAERKQQEADAAKAEAEAKLAELVAAGKEVGLEIFIAKEADNA